MISAATDDVEPFGSTHDGDACWRSLHCYRCKFNLHFQTFSPIILNIFQNFPYYSTTISEYLLFQKLC